MSSDHSRTEFVHTTVDRPTVDDTAEIRCRGCGETFERTDPRVFGAPVAYTCPHCDTTVRLWMAGGELQYEG
ncbi:hypothetical protein RYH80_12460 [Halobaculum sp. MBLA0147]|uniref:hypothetical protein n=1 Tax=Halobaculum sp. MBLA0147 TaxID=3079934 RepID=UPI0035268E48